MLLVSHPEVAEPADEEDAGRGVQDDTRPVLNPAVDESGHRFDSEETAGGRKGQR